MIALAAGSFAAGFVAFPIVALAIGGAWAWRHYKDVTRW